MHVPCKIVYWTIGCALAAAATVKLPAIDLDLIILAIGFSGAAIILWALEPEKGKPGEDKDAGNRLRRVGPKKTAE